jgi:nitric oxide reductase NorD protein
MRSPRVLMRAKRAASRLVDRLPAPPWRREHPVVALESVRRRLELLLAAMYGRAIPIASPATHRESWWRRAARAASPFQQVAPLPASDGESLRLPPSMDASGGDATALARYRLLAIEQGERVMRGTSAIAAAATDSLERDLFLLRESASVDAAIARTTRGFVPALTAARADALARRPLLESLAGAERDVEHLVRQLLAAHPTAPPEQLGETASAEESLAWARDMAARLRSTQDRYRGVPPVDLWGRVLPPTAGALAAAEGRKRSSLLGGGMFNLVELESAEQGGRERPADVARGEIGRKLSKSATGDRSSRGHGEHRSAEDAVAGLADDTSTGLGAARVGASEIEPVARDDVVYPEWDFRASHYRSGAVIVRRRAAREVEQTWATARLQEHAALVRHVRERFERLRARRARLPQQREGDELDIAACVHALVDARTGHSVDDRLYVAVRPARREMAILLLVDVSGSTDAMVTKSLQVIDVEKIALLLAGEALDALGDRYAMLTFSGKGTTSVRLTTIKDFAERNGVSVRRRVSALRPEANTRLGAAIRHATALLDAQPAGHRLLLILSDGKPNDVDEYQGQYGVEDSRQAINEARARDVYPFCLTVDREESSYLQRIFGRAGYAILPHPDQLPMALLKVVRHLLES